MIASVLCLAALCSVTSALLALDGMFVDVRTIKYSSVELTTFDFKTMKSTTIQLPGRGANPSDDEMQVISQGRMVYTANCRYNTTVRASDCWMTQTDVVQSKLLKSCNMPKPSFKKLFWSVMTEKPIALIVDEKGSVLLLFRVDEYLGFYVMPDVSQCADGKYVKLDTSGLGLRLKELFDFASYRYARFENRGIVIHLSQDNNRKMMTGAYEIDLMTMAINHTEISEKWPKFFSVDTVNKQWYLTLATGTNTEYEVQRRDIFAIGDKFEAIPWNDDNIGVNMFRQVNEFLTFNNKPTVIAWDPQYSYGLVGARSMDAPYDFVTSQTKVPMSWSTQFAKYIPLQILQGKTQ